MLISGPSLASPLKDIAYIPSRNISSEALADVSDRHLSPLSHLKGTFCARQREFRNITLFLIPDALLLLHGIVVANQFRLLGQQLQARQPESCALGQALQLHFALEDIIFRPLNRYFSGFGATEFSDLRGRASLS